jgi:hypothetical protein
MSFIQIHSFADIRTKFGARTLEHPAPRLAHVANGKPNGFGVPQPKTDPTYFDDDMI